MKVLKIWRDEFSESPREWDNLGTMVCWHKKYNLGDQHDFRTPDEFQKWAKSAELAVVMPLYLYDHSGITISTNGWRYPYNDCWDAGQVGWIYAAKDRLRERYRVRRVTKRLIGKAANELRNEVEIYDQYLRGDVYGFTVFDMDDLVVVESVGGFYGSCPTENGMMAHVPEEFRKFLDGKILHAGLLITDDGREFDCNLTAANKILDALRSDITEKYLVVRSLLS